MDRREALKRTFTLTGVALSSSVTMAVLNGCKATGSPDWNAKFFTEEEIRLVSAITDVIIPETDTPGAVSLHVPEFIDIILSDCYEDAAQSIRPSMTSWSEKVLASQGMAFYECKAQEKVALIQTLEEELYADRKKAWSSSFYMQVKMLTLLGYFSSEYVMKNLLDYKPIHTELPGCIPLDEGTRITVQ